MSFIIKIDRLQVAIKKHREAGGDMHEVEAEVREIERLVALSQFTAAEERLTRLLDGLRRGAFRRTG